MSVIIGEPIWLMVFCFEKSNDDFNYSCANDENKNEVNKDCVAAKSMLQLVIALMITGRRLAPWDRMCFVEFIFDSNASDSHKMRYVVRCRSR